MPHQLIRDEKTGKGRINKVPIFGLGEARGFLYDKDWAERLVFNMTQRAKKGWYAPFFVGHNSSFFDENEKPADGFLDNYQVDVYDAENNLSAVFADLIDIHPEAIPAVTDMRFPYRSVEIYSESAFISGMALLGGTEPHFKFPRLEIAENFGAKPTTESVKLDFKTTDQGLEYFVGSKTGKVKAAWEAFKQMVAELAGVDDIDEMDANERGKMNLAVRDDDKTNFAGGAGEQQQEEIMPDIKMTPEQIAQFKAEHGMTPDEMAAQFKKQQEQAAADRVIAFKAKLDTYKVLPAIRDEAVKIAEFAKDEASEKALFSLLETVLLKAQKNELFADTGEQTLHNHRTGSPVKYSNDNEMFEAIQALMKKENLTFDAANVKIINGMEG